MTVTGQHPPIGELERKVPLESLKKQRGLADMLIMGSRGYSLDGRIGWPDSNDGRLWTLAKTDQFRISGGGKMGLENCFRF